MTFKALLVLGILVGVLVIVVAVTFMVFRNQPSEINFLYDALSGREEAAFSSLSNDFQNIVRSQCPNGTVSACVDELISSDWGQLKEIRFAIGSDATNTQLYHVFWSELSSPVSVVLVIARENGKTVINGWRGFTVSEGEDADSDLLHGQRHDNELSG